MEYIREKKMKLKGGELDEQKQQMYRCSIFLSLTSYALMPLSE